MFDANNITTLLNRVGKSDYVKDLYDLGDEYRLLIEKVEAISSNYENNYIKSLIGTEIVFRELMNELKQKCDFAYYTSRFKDIDSLIVKIITKYIDAKKSGKAEDSKYLAINPENYYRIITDLLGFRILTRFPQEWYKIDRCIRGSMDNNNNEKGILVNDINKYLKDWIVDYCSDVNSNPFLVEQPKWYYLSTDEEEPLFPITDNLENDVVSRFDVIPSKMGYRSIHYLINYRGVYIELQVRTLAFEAWSECEHKTGYKFTLSDSREKDLLDIYSHVSANLIGIFSKVTERMYAIKNALDKPYFYNDSLFSIMSSLLLATGDLIERGKKFNQNTNLQQKNNINDFSNQNNHYINNEILSKETKINEFTTLRIGDFHKLFN